MSTNTRLYLRYLKVLALTACIASGAFSQSAKTPTANEGLIQKDSSLERLSLLNDLQILDREAIGLNDPLAQALAKAEIADAAWQLDREWAKKLLRTAYDLTLPKTEQNQRQDKPVGSIPTMPNAMDRAQRKIRSRILQIAHSDKKFVNELLQIETDNTGAYGKHYASAVLASQVLEEGDVNSSADYVLQGIKADPTRGTAPSIINEIAIRDRAQADRLILQYIGELRKFPLSSTNQSDFRTFITLSSLVNAAFIPDPNVKIPPAGAEVHRAYISYMLDALKSLEQQEPGYLQGRRQLLLSLWVPLQQYAPELAGTFFNLESDSRRPGEKSSLPYKSNEELRKERYEKRVKEALDNGQPDELTINSAISRDDFDKARKLIDKLPDGAQKTQFIEDINTREAISLATKGDTLSAESLAEKLSKAVSVLQVYPLIINKCVAKKDNQCATTAFYQALRQLKNADVTPNTPPAGIPASVVATGKEFDPVLSSLGKLAKAVLPVNDEFAFQALDEMVQAANRSELDTSQGRTGFEADVFKLIAAKNEPRAQQAALNLKDELRQIVALATIDQWKAKELADKEKAADKIKAADKAKALNAPQKIGDDKKK